MSKLTDSCKMPFGKYQGFPMEDVPAKYLLWLKDNISATYKPKHKKQIDDKERVFTYIEDNLDVLTKEAEENEEEED